MKTVRDKAAVHAEACPGCSICVKVCPTTAIHMQARLAVIAEATCIGCNACEQACPFGAITMVAATQRSDPRTSQAPVDAPWDIEIDVSPKAARAADDLCLRAGLHPDQLLCVCVEGLRARNVAAKILDGCVHPQALALATGLRSGCTVLCMTGLMRLLQAARVDVESAPDKGWNWYPGALSQFDLPDELDRRYGRLGYSFAEDRKLLQDLLQRAASRRGTDEGAKP